MSVQKDIRSQGLTYRLHSLTKRFGRKLDTIQKLGTKIRLLEASASPPPGLLKKMTRWVAQLSLLQEQESKILKEITALERKHKALRKEKRVRFAKSMAALPMPAPEPRSKRRKGFWLLAILVFLTDEDTKRRLAAHAPKNG